MSTDDYVSSNAAFLWCLKGNNNNAIKCPVLQGGNAALFDYASAGPVFGAVRNVNVNSIAHFHTFVRSFVLCVFFTFSLR